jgi:hypothetical protein
MKPFLVIATINELANLKGLIEELCTTSTKVIVVDEGDESIRARNERILQSVSRAYYGPKERREWFKERFGKNYEKFLSVIPERAHAETSFGFLVAYEEGADFIIELDDDVLIRGLIEGHRSNLFGETGETVSSRSRWYNTMDAIALNEKGSFFPRGHPYSPETRVENYKWRKTGGTCALNMGHWTGNPDLDALTILYYGGLDGRCHVKGTKLKRDKVIVGKGTYFAVCSMNAAFAPKVVPAFYQLYMNTMGIDRFDDIWSGIFLKRVADHLDDSICLGRPVGVHDKRPRSVFKDLKKEMDGMMMNETVWKMIEGDIGGKSYSDAYLSLTDLLASGAEKLLDENYKRFLKLQAEKMRLWVEAVDSV